MRGLAIALVLGAGCVTPSRPQVVKPPIAKPSSPAPGDSALSQLVTDFVAAAEERDFARVLPLLSADLRARYSPERLSQDFASDPLAGERVQRVRQALGKAAFRVDGTRAELPLADGRCLQAVKEAEGWRIAALEATTAASSAR